MLQADLGADEAIDEIRGMQTYTGALSQRAIGLTWVIWGLVLAGMVLSYNQWATFDPARTSALADSFLRFLFVPWLVVGGFVTWLLWRTIGLAIPGRARQSGIAWAVILAAIVLVGVGTVFVANNLSHQVTSTAVLLMGVGIATSFAGLLGVIGGDRFSQGVAVGIGAVVLVSTLVVSTLGTAGSQQLFETFTWLGPGLVLLAYVGGGSLLAIRG